MKQPNRTFKAFIFTLMALIASLNAQAQDIEVKGNITDATFHEPVMGAAIRETGTDNGVVSDIDGNFSLKVRQGATLTISYIGMVTQTLPATAVMNIVMAEDDKVMEEVVVVGYSTQRKVDVTGAINSVNVDDLAKQNENNVVKAMQGRVPGMNSTADGGPSGAATVRIRGVGTLNNNDPLYIIDGVPTKAGMHELNGSDIESIQVLKDAASASIYGSRAANGVIIITTKKGKDLKITLDASVAASFYANKIEVLNAKEYGQCMWQAYVNSNQDPNTNGLGYTYDWGYDANGNPVLHGVTMSKYLDVNKTTPAADTDWIRETTRTGVVQNYNLSVSGSTDKMSGFLSVGYYSNKGIIKYSDFDRLSARVNTEFKPLEGIVTIGEHFTLNRTSEVQAPGGFIENAMQFNPSLPVYTVNGDYAGPVAGYPDRENPLARLERNKDNRYSYWRLFGDAYLNINPMKGLNIRTTFGIDYAQKEQRIFTYPITEGNVANSQTGALDALDVERRGKLRQRLRETPHRRAHRHRAQPRELTVLLRIQGGIRRPQPRLHVARRRLGHSHGIRLGRGILAHIIFRQSELCLRQPLPHRSHAALRRLGAIRQKQPIRHLPVRVSRMAHQQRAIHGENHQLARRPQTPSLMGHNRQPGNLQHRAI